MKIEELEHLWGLQPGEIAAMMRPIVGEDATLEEIEAAVTELMDNIDRAMHRVYTLEECLSFPTKEDLVELAKAMRLKGYGKMRKEELQRFLYGYLSSPDYMYHIYPSLHNGEIAMMRQLYTSNVPLISTDIMFSVATLMQNGLCYLDAEGKHLLLPAELKEAFIDADIDDALQLAQKEYSVFYDTCNAAVYFYGVYPLDELCQIIQKRLRRPVSEVELLQWHATSAIYREEFYFKNGYLISAALRNAPEDVIALQQIQKMKKRAFWPTKEAIEALSIDQWLIDDQLYEPLWEFASILMENEFGDIMSVSRFVEASIRTGAPFDALMGFLSEQIFAFESIEEVDRFAQIMQNIWNNTPMWENCGYSPNQMKALHTVKQNAPKNNVISLAERRAKKNK